jgi:hypothetical protein
MIQDMYQKRGIENSMNRILPIFLKSHFWDTNFESLTWESYRDFIIRRILQSGSWQAILWLRAEVGDPELRQWIIQQRGAGLSPRQLRFWQVVFELPGHQVTRWIQAASANPWEKRLSQ